MNYINTFKNYVLTVQQYAVISELHNE